MTQTPELILDEVTQATNADYFMPTAGSVSEPLVKVTHSKGLKMGVWTEVDHTADWSIRVHGATLPELFVNAATGMYSLVADLTSATPTIERAIEVKGVDAEALLVNWLNELLYHTEMDGEVFCEFAIHSFEPTHLSSTARAGRGSNLKKHIKAVTFHNLSIVATGDGYEVTLVFDV